MNIVERGSKEERVGRVENLLEYTIKIMGEDDPYTSNMREVVEFWRGVDENEFDPLTEEEKKKMVKSMVSGYMYEMKRMKGINPYGGFKGFDKSPANDK